MSGTSTPSAPATPRPPRRSAPAASRPALGSLALAGAGLAALLALTAWPVATAAAPSQPVAPRAGSSTGAAGPARPAVPAVPASSAPPETFVEKVLVREIEVVVELPESMRESRRKALGPQDFQVTEDGRFRQVVKASPVMAGEAGPWQLVIYVDRVLAEPETVFVTANALAQRSAQLTALGTVALVVADPAPRILLAETREPKMLEQALTDIAAQAERQRAASSHPAPGHAQGPASGQAPLQASGPASGSAKPQAQPGAAPRQEKPAALAPEPEVVRRQEDQLVALLAGRSGGGPRALVLVANGFDTSTSGGGADSAKAAVAEEPGRTLAAYGWITLAASMRRQELGTPHREMTDVERIRQSNSGRDAPGSRVPPEILPQAAPKSILQYDEVLSLFVEPTSATLTAMASATAGTVIGTPGQLTTALKGLTRRWHIFYLAPDPEDGKTRPVEVRLSPEGAALRTPVWRRSSTPDEVAAARLRRALAGGAEHGTLPLTATATVVTAAPAHPGEQRRALRVTVGAFSPPDSLAAGPFRLSIAFAGGPGAAPTVEHRLLTGAGLSEKGWTETLPLDVPPGARKLGVAVEDLTHQLWGATVVDLGAPPATH
jgi:hypothetical protein